MGFIVPQCYRRFRQMGIGLPHALPVPYNQFVFGNDKIRLGVLVRATENKLVDKCIK